MNPLLRGQAFAERLRGALWFLPTVTTVLALVGATYLVRVQVPESWFIAPALFDGNASSALTLLSTIAGSMITLTGLVFTLTVVALQIAAGQYSPRLLRDFLRDRGNQWTLAVFVATFGYSVAVLRTIRANEDSTLGVPDLAVTVAILLVLASIAMLVYFLHHLTTSIRIENVMREARLRTLEIVDRVYPETAHRDGPSELPEPPDDAVEVEVPYSGYLQNVDPRELLQVACEQDAIVRARSPLGTLVTEGSVLAWAWPANGQPLADPDALADRVRQAVRVGFERTTQQDVAFGIRQLVDVAVKALSPGINDPTTAVDAVGHISVILCRLARRHLDHDLREDGDGRLRTAIPRPSFPAYVELGLGQIRRYGANEPAVMAAVLRVLVDLSRTVTNEGALKAVQRQARLALEDAERETAQPADVEPLRDLAGLVADGGVALHRKEPTIAT